MKKTHVNKPLTLIKKRGITLTVILLTWWLPALAQVDAEQVLAIGRNVLSMDDYMLSIQYFNQAIKAKPYLADPYFFRALANWNSGLQRSRRGLHRRNRAQQIQDRKL